MRITVLTENTSRCGFPTEHGLSLYVESGQQHFLFDTGQTALFSENAERLGIDPGSVDFAVLSHGHYDHGGGIMCFLEINDHAPVYMNPFVFEPHYNGTEKNIGLDPELRSSGRIVFTEEGMQIFDGMTLYFCNDRPKVKDLGSFGLNMVRNGQLVPDDFRHEQYLMVEENGRRILFSGCSHKGIINIVDWFRPDVLIGGFHFSKLPADETLAGYAKKLDSYDTVYYTCHCTGEIQYGYMKKYMKNLHYISTGETIVI